MSSNFDYFYIQFFILYFIDNTILDIQTDVFVCCVRPMSAYHVYFILRYCFFTL